jgi:hypothetical protein
MDETPEKYDAKQNTVLLYLIIFLEWDQCIQTIRESKISIALLVIICSSKKNDCITDM